VKGKFSGLKADLKSELEELEKLVSELEDLKPSENSEEVDRKTLRAIGSVLHDFYSGIENMLKRVAMEMEGELPRGGEWHRQLLARMSVKIDEVRPPVISKETRDKLEEYMRFRHLFRHSYGFELKWKRCRDLCFYMPDLFKKIADEIGSFIGFLDKLAEKT